VYSVATVAVTALLQCIEKPSFGGAMAGPPFLHSSEPLPTGHLLTCLYGLPGLQ